MHRMLGFPLALALSCAACSGSPAPADVSVTSTSSALRIRVHFASDPPVRGTNRAELTVTGASDGTPRDGYTVAVRPWMPAMDHGSSTPTVTPEGGGSGKYLVTELYLYMPGQWDLQTALNGPTSDHATLPVQVP